MNAKVAVAIIAIASFSTAAVAAPAQDEVGFDDYSGVTSDGTVVQGATPYEGPYKKALSDADFYRAIGRDDLAAQYDANVSHNRKVAVGGVVTILGGVGLGAAVAASSCQNGDLQNGCATGGIVLGSLGIAVGSLILGAAMQSDPNPVDLPARRELADEHNQSLHVQLAPNGVQVKF